MADEPIPHWAQKEHDSLAPLAIGIVVAVMVHAGLATTTTLAPPKKMEERIEMAVYKKPPPPPPPNQEHPPEPPKDEPPPPVVTGVTMSSVVEGNSGMNVRVGNTTFGDPNKEKFVDPKDVKPYQGGSPEFKAARASTITREAKVLKDYRGTYPKELAEQGVEGKVITAVEISKTGEIRDVRIVKSCGNATLDKLAVEYIKRFRFQAAEVNGEAVDSILRYTYTFELFD